MMGRSKRTPDRSRIVHGKTSAFSRRKRGAGDRDGDDEKNTDETDEVASAPASESPFSAITEPAIPALRDGDELPAIVPPDPKGEPWPDATPVPTRPVDPGPAVRAGGETVAMPMSAFGGPPEMPRSVAPPPLMLGDVENPAHMPGPRDIPAGDPGDPAPAPGSVPRGDSRSLRRGAEFALIYRIGTSVISRCGTLGTRGQWRVVEYPTSAAAANSYAKECSRFVSDGFVDYRE